MSHSPMQRQQQQPSTHCNQDTTNRDRMSDRQIQQQNGAYFYLGYGEKILFESSGLPVALVTLGQAAKMIHCGKTLLRAEIAANRIRAVKVGRSLRVDVASLVDWIRSRPAAKLRRYPGGLKNR